MVFFTLILTLKIHSASPESRGHFFQTKMANMDFLGAALLVGAVCCLLLALQWGGNTLPWRSATVIGLFIGFVVTILVFATLQWFLGDRGTISPQILRQRSVLMGCIFEFVLRLTLYTVRALSFGLTASLSIETDGLQYSYCIPFYLQAVESVSATTSGVRYIVFVPDFVAIIMSGVIVSKVGYYVRPDMK